jgi:predicted HTH transcriptional regulator
MDALELLDLIQKGESSVVQFKVRINDAYKTGTEMVAFSNTKGGLIIIGVDDKTGDIDGLSFKEIANTNQLLANAASDNVRPQIFIETETVEVENKNVIVANISEGLSKPHTDNKGIIWLKNGSDKRKVVAREEMARLLQSSGNLFADETIVNGTTINDINEKLLGRFIEKKHEKSIDELGLPLSELLSNMGMLKSGNLTLGGLLLFGRNPQLFRPTFTVHCIAIKGNDISTNNYRNKKEPFEGSIDEVYEKTLSFIIQNLKETQIDNNFNSGGQLEIPKETIIELLVNALVHRDYFINSSVKVFVFDDRIEIISPGKLPNTLTIENIKSGISVIRNPILYSNVPYLLPFEGVGSGIRRAYNKYPDLELINDTERELFISVIKRPE